MNKDLALGPGLKSQVFHLLLSGSVESVRMHTHLQCEDSVRSRVQSPGMVTDTQPAGSKMLLLSSDGVEGVVGCWFAGG